MPVACPVRTHLPRLAWLVAMAIALTQALLGGPAAAEFMAFQGPFTAVGTFAPAGARCPGGVPFVRTYQYTFEVAAVVVDAMTTPPSAFRGDFSINWSDNCGGGSGITGGGTFVPLTVTGNAVTGTHVDGPWTDSISAIIREHEIVGTWTQTLDDGVWTGTASGQFVLPRFMFIESIRLETPRVVNGRTVTATVTLSSAAPPGGILIALEAKTTWPLLLPKPAAATVPSSVTVPAGQRTVTFSVDVGDVLFPVAAQITGTYSGQAIRPS